MAQNETMFRSFLRALDELGRVAVGETDLRKLATTATAVIRNCLDLPYVAMVRVDHDRGLLEYLADAADVVPNVQPGDTQPISRGVVGLCARELVPVFVEDVRLEPDYVEIIPGVTSELAVPILARGKAVGVLNCEATSPGVLEEARMFLEVAADRLGVAVENSILLRERDAALKGTRDDARRLELLNNIARIAAESLEMRAMLQRVVEAIARGFEWEFVACAVVDRERAEFECQAVYSRVPTEVYPGYRRALGSGVVGEVAATGNAIHVPDARMHANFVETLAGTLSELCVPVFDHEGVVIAVLNLESIRLNAFDGLLTLVQTVARQLSGAITNAKLYAETRRREDHLHGLSDLSRLVLETPGLEEVIRRVVRFVYERMGFPVVGMVLLNPSGDSYRLVAHEGSIPVAFDAGTFPITQGIVGRCLRLALTQFVPDVRKDGDLVSTSGEICAELCIPILYRGKVLGALNVESTSADDFGPDTRLVLQAFVDQVAGAIANAQLYAEAQRRASELQMLSEFTRSALTANQLEEFLENCVRFVAQRMDIPSVALLLYDDATDTLTHAADAGTLPLSVKRGHRWAPGAGIIGRSIRSARPALIRDVSQDPDYIAVNASVRCEYVVPIRYRGKVLGALNVEDVVPDAFDDEMRLVLRTMVDQVAGALHLAQVNAQLGEANRSLTELFSRYVAPNLAEQLLRDPDSLHTRGERREVSVMFADIRGFTSISQRIDTPRVFDLLNEFFPRMTEAVFQHRGSINRFLGDGFMAVFGAPEQLKGHARAAIDAAFELQHRVGDFGKRWQQLTGEPLRVVTVINSGEVIYGSIGDPRHREFTVLGDVVNVASRLETEAKNRNARILVTADVYRAAGEHAPAHDETVLLRGREGEVRVFQLL